MANPDTKIPADISIYDGDVDGIRLVLGTTDDLHFRLTGRRYNNCPWSEIVKIQQESESASDWLPESAGTDRTCPHILYWPLHVRPFLLTLHGPDGRESWIICRTPLDLLMTLRRLQHGYGLVQVFS